MDARKLGRVGRNKQEARQMAGRKRSRGSRG